MMQRSDQTEQRVPHDVRLGLLVWIRLMRTYQRLSRAASEHLAPWNLSIAQFDVIAQIGAAENLTQQELAERLFVTQGNITQLLDKLEQRGLIRRSKQGRCNLLMLTDQGQELYDEVVPAHERAQAARFGNLTHEEQHQLLSLLRKITREPR
jgi:DNA-binding MarR family transcriptional regulator